MPGNLHIYRENDIIQMLCMDYIGTPGIVPDLLQYWRTGADFLLLIFSVGDKIG